MAYILRRRCNN